MSNPLAKLRDECTRLLEEALNEAYPGTELPSTRFSTPPDPEMGELSSAASFQLARSLRSRPAEIAEKIAEKVVPSSLVESAEAVNGYVNFKADAGSSS